MSKARILIVDDEPDIIMSLTMRLRANDYEVISAMDGMQATTTALREKPDLVVLDIGMPAGDGHVVAQRLRENVTTMHIPIIFLTARTADDDYMKALQQRVDKYLTKPYQPEQLLESIEECLDKVANV